MHKQLSRYAVTVRNKEYDSLLREWSTINRFTYGIEPDNPLAGRAVRKGLKEI